MTIFALTLSALACLPVVLRVAAPDAALSLLLPVTLIGATLGFMLHARRQRWTRIDTAFVVFGLVMLLIRIGQLASAVLESANATLRLSGVLLLEPSNLLASMQESAAWIAAQRQFWEQSAALLSRAGTWLIAVAQGQSSTDLAARALCLGAGAWVASTWASWRISGRSDALGGLLPTSIWMGIALSSTLQDPWPMWLHVASFLLLLAILNLSGLTRRWQREGTDFSDSAPEDTLTSALALIIILLLVSYSVSAFSLKDLLDSLREQPRPTTSAAAPASGTAASSNVRSGAPTGVQDTHDISGGPQLSRDVVMVIRTGDLPPIQHAEGIQAPRYYWRGVTYQYYTGLGWNNPTTAIVETAPNEAIGAIPPEGFRAVHGVVRLPAGTGRVAYWTGMLVNLNAPLEVVWRSQPQQTTARPTPVPIVEEADMIGAQFPGSRQPGSSYEFHALLHDATENELRAAPTTYPAWVQNRYLELPPGLPDRVRALARDLTVQAATPYDQALAIETYLRKIPYSLDVPAPPVGRDAADYFLFDLKKGYCDYYATSMAVLARAAGLPARLVTGYASGSYDPYAANYIVRKADAHAWTEIYFSGIGWIEFEPTANQPAPRREKGLGKEDAPGPKSGGSENQALWLRLPTIDARVWGLAWWMLAAAMLLPCASLIADEVRLRAMEPDKATRRLYHRLRRTTRRINGSAPVAQTAREFAAAFRMRMEAASENNRLVRRLVSPIGAAVDELTVLYMRSLFAPAPLGRTEGRRAIRTWSVMRWRLALLNATLMFSRHAASGQSVPSILPNSEEA